MELNLVDPNHVPLPPEDVRIESVEVRPYPDGRRLKIEAVLTPFQVRPDVEFIVLDEEGNEAGSASVIESISHRISLTCHIKRPTENGVYRLDTKVSYHDEEEGEQIVDEHVIELRIIDPDGSSRGAIS